ncbi:MAG: S9 family peptidase [Acidobacteria bacterium]|nr:MAG: S9 family peptidase [Acidobacteriota bacterium]
MCMKIRLVDRGVKLLAAALCAAALCASAERAETSVEQVLNSLAAVREFSQVAISPDGARIAWVESLRDKGGGNSAIYIADLRNPSAALRRISAGAGAELDVAWSPDGRRLAFLSDAAKKGQRQLYVAEAGPLQPMSKDAGVVEQRIYEQRLAVVDAASGRVRQISPADLYVYEYDWSPDGKNFTATAAPGAGDTNWYLAELSVISAATGETRSIFKPSLQIAVPRWSPDGQAIAFISGLMSDEGSTGGDVFVIPASGGEPRNLTPGMNASASWLGWLPSSTAVLFAEEVDGAAGLAGVDVADGNISTFFTGPETFTASPDLWGLSFSLARDGKTSAVIRHSFSRPPEVWAGPVGEWKQITRANQSLSPLWGEHGGPSGAVLPDWPRAYNLAMTLASRGYFVFLPNPRGSFGQGETFTQANVRDFGYGDFRDIMTGVDELIEQFPVDENKVGVTGWSYGGYMTMWAVTQTTRFRAAVAGAGIANWQSYYGENDIDQWMIPFFGASVYDDPDAYAKSSPINFIKNVKTPTLVLVGDSDGECPPPQSYEFWHALKTLGVETQFVLYPNEGHAFLQPEHKRDVVQRAVAWFDRHLR